jgi:hypothetical protein
MNIRISEETRSSEEAIFDVFTDYAGNTGWPIPFWPRRRYALHVNFANVNPRFVPQSYYLLPEDVDTVRIELVDVQRPLDEAALKTFPRMGMSIANLIVNSSCHIAETICIFADCGVQTTRVNLLSALWPGVDVLPYRRRADGLWDLYDWNPEYFDRLSEVRDCCNYAGIQVQWTNYELYSWSDRKPGPQQDNTPWRHNINGVLWRPDDYTFGVLPDTWSQEWFRKVVPYLRTDINPFEIGNELPEKALHEKVLKAVRAIQPNALVQVNRNEDTPGQYTNMKIGRPGSYDSIAFHGRNLKQVSDLDDVYRKEPDYPSFDDFFAYGDYTPHCITFSSDGARTHTYDRNGVKLTDKDSADNPYDWARLHEFARHVYSLGFNFEHQSRAKMTPAPNHHMIETDWFASLRK